LKRKKQGLKEYEIPDLPCETCENAPPELFEENNLLHSVLKRCISCRNFNGGLDWFVFFKLMDLEKLDSDFQSVLFDEALHIQNIIFENDKARQEKPPNLDGSSTLK
jgi:hypothetical protein